MLLACPICGMEIDPAGPAVAADREGNSHWSPFVEDRRGTPHRLVHARCFADEAGVDALIEVVHAHDTIVVDGWILSASEARLCALMHLRSSTA